MSDIDTLMRDKGYDLGETGKKGQQITSSFEEKVVMQYRAKPNFLSVEVLATATYDLFTNRVDTCQSWI